LLGHAHPIFGYRFWTQSGPEYVPPNSRLLISSLREAILNGIPPHSSSAPTLLWCFLDTDRHVHYYGYDDLVHEFLTLVEQLAIDLARKGAIVIAHSDHGLTPTTHSSAMADALANLAEARGYVMGGAGRMRWLYGNSGSEAERINELKRCLPASVRVSAADELFAKDSLSRRRVGNIVLTAGDEEFITSPKYKFDHGSDTEAELYVPFSVWKGAC
jgi:hypothetical protein